MTSVMNRLVTLGVLSTVLGLAGAASAQTMTAGTAKGVIFMTLEDETGFVNVIVWPKVFEEHFVVARSASFLGVEGQIQNARGVVHLVARKLYRPNLDVPVEGGSRNFH